MLQLRKGSSVPFPEKLVEGYTFEEPYFTANVGADKIEMMIKHFISMHNEPMFFILELPTRINDETEIRSGIIEQFHKDVYYIDGCTQEEALAILSRSAEILINDGLCSFGFGCHKSHDEIMFGKYNVTYVYAPNKETFDGFFEEHKIKKVENLITAWDTFTPEFFGESSSAETDGKCAYDVLEDLKELGIYFFERRED